MPTNRKRIARGRRSPIPETIMEFLKTGEVNMGTPGEPGRIELFMMRYDDKKTAEKWEEARDLTLPEWIEKHPGTRPYAWWIADAPRWNDPYEGVFFHGTMPEPRQRLGGTGTPNYEVLAYVPYFSFGIPDSWLDQWSVDYYNGRAKDINGNPIGTEYKEGDLKGIAIDENDPPVFESQASYLKRHGLLTASEKRALKKMPEAWQPETITFEEDSTDNQSREDKE